MPDRILTNTSCLIALDSVDQISLLGDLYEEILIPEAVKKEFGSIDLKSKRRIEVRHPLVNLFRMDLNLGKGESEVIAYAYQEQLSVIIDDQKARGVAKELGVMVTGTIGVLLKAEECGIIESSFEIVNSLRKHGFYVSEKLLQDLK